jgi:hypothetical protein
MTAFKRVTTTHVGPVDKSRGLMGLVFSQDDVWLQAVGKHSGDVEMFFGGMNLTVHAVNVLVRIPLESFPQGAVEDEPVGRFLDAAARVSRQQGLATRETLLLGGSVEMRLVVPRQTFVYVMKRFQRDAGLTQTDDFVTSVVVGLLEQPVVGVDDGDVTVLCVDATFKFAGFKVRRRGHVVFVMNVHAVLVRVDAVEEMPPQGFVHNVVVDQETKPQFLLLHLYYVCSKKRQN